MAQLTFNGDPVGDVEFRRAARDRGISAFSPNEFPGLFATYPFRGSAYLLIAGKHATVSRSIPRVYATISAEDGKGWEATLTYRRWKASSLTFVIFGMVCLYGGRADLAGPVAEQVDGVAMISFGAFTLAAIGIYSLFWWYFARRDAARCLSLFGDLGMTASG